MQKSSNVTAGKPKKGGAVWRAPFGTPLPADAKSELDAAFQGLGYISEEGLVNTNSPSNESIRAWGGDTVLDIQNEKSDLFKFTLIEAMNPEVLRTAYGDSNVSGELGSGITVQVNSEEAPYCAWVIDMILKGGVLKRIVIPDAKLTEMEDISYKDDSAVSYGITISAVPDDSGNTHYEYMVAKAGTPAGRQEE